MGMLKREIYMHETKVGATTIGRLARTRRIKRGRRLM